MNMKPPLQRTANRLAERGRFGDTQLVHMNPAEVSGLAAMSPTGQLTINPDTGQPEAFLPFLAPLLGSAFGTAALGGTALGAAGAGALGSGLATWAATGDFEKGLISGVTGFGLGKMMGAAKDVGEASKLATDAAAVGVDAGAVKAAQEGAQSFLGSNAANAATMDQAASFSGLPEVLPVSPTPTFGQNLANIGRGLTSREGLAAAGSQLMSPSSAIPIAIGESTRANMEAQEQMERLQKENTARDNRYAQSWRNVLTDSLGMPRGSNPNPYMGRYASGGSVAAEAPKLTQKQKAEKYEEARREQSRIHEEAKQAREHAFYNGELTLEQVNRLEAQGLEKYNKAMEAVKADLDIRSLARGGIVGMENGGILGELDTLSDEEYREKMANLDVGQLAGLGTGTGRVFGLDENNRYKMNRNKLVEDTGSQRQSFLRGDFKQDPPSDYRHGFEEEFQFFDFIEDRPIERYADLFGAGPSNYLAGLLSGDTGNAPTTPITYDDEGNRTGGTDPTKPGAYSESTITCYPTDGGEAFEVTGVNPVCPVGSDELPPAQTLKSTCYTANGDGTYSETQSTITGVCPVGSYQTQAEADSAWTIENTTTITCYKEGETPQEVSGINPTCPVGWSTTEGGGGEPDVDPAITCYNQETGEAQQFMGTTCPVGWATTAPDTTATTNVLYDDAGNEYEVEGGWTNDTVASYLADGTLTDAEAANIANLLELSTDEGDAAIMGTFGAFDDSFGTQFQEYLDSLETTEPVIIDEPPEEDPTCPSPETLIKLKDGETTAGELKVGDLVHTQHEHTLEWGDWPVTHAEIVENQPRLKLSFDDKKIVCSWSHKFYVDGKEWVKAEDMKIGDVVNGKVLHHVSWWSDGDVVKITVDEAHTYIAADLLSHNKSLEPCPEGYHREYVEGEGWTCVPDTTDTSTVDIDDVVSGSVASIATQEDINALVDGVVDGSVSAQSIADHYDVDVDDVQDEIDTILADRLDDVDEQGIEYLLSEINAGNLTAAEVAARYGLTEAEVQDEVDLLNARGVADDTAGEDASEPGNRGGLIRQYITDTFGEGPYTQEQALQFSQVAISEGVSAAEVAEALGMDEAVVQGFYDRAANPVDMSDAQAQTAVIDDLGLDADVYTADDFVGLSEAEINEIFAQDQFSQGGRTKRFMTPLGMVHMQDGGIAALPANLPMTQEVPEEVMVSETEEVIPEPLPDTDYPELVDMTIEAIRGNVEDPDPIINQFIEEYGVEAFRELREAVLQSIVPNAQTEGRIGGSGGGMDDEVMGMIGESQPVAVSPDEYIVAADVVSGLGDGSSEAGAEVLDEMMTNVRKARSGGRQPKPINKAMIVPA